MNKQFLVFAIAVTFASSANAQATFRDVPDNHWAAAAVKRLAEAGIIIGRPTNEATISSDKKNDISDAALVCPRVKAALVANPALEQEIIDVNAISPIKSQPGIVTLIGTVKNVAQRTLAATITRKTAPDYVVINQLKIVAARSPHSR